jgi:hypothetical protein
VIDQGSRRGFLWNISVRGVYLVIDPIPAVEQRFEISFPFPGGEQPVNVHARVAWQNPPSVFRGCGTQVNDLPPGCGLEFLALTSADHDRIEAFVRRFTATLGR